MAYERITEATSIGDYCSTSDCYEKCDQCYVKKMFYRLCELEDKIESGLLVELPCKVGDIVYIIAKQGLDIYSAEKVMIVDFWYSKQDKCLYAIDKDGTLYREVYATKQEAEAKLKELRGE